MQQFDQETRTKVHKHCAAAYIKAQQYINEIQARLKDEATITNRIQDERHIQHLTMRQKQLKISILLVLNTERIKEMRQAMVEGWEVQLTDGSLKPRQIEIRKKQIHIIKKAQNCKNVHCGGKGWTGIKVKSRELELCACTLKTIDYYVTLD